MLKNRWSAGPPAAPPSAVSQITSMGSILSSQGLRTSVQENAHLLRFLFPKSCPFRCTPIIGYSPCRKTIKRIGQGQKKRRIFRSVLACRKNPSGFSASLLQSAARISSILQSQYFISRVAENSICDWASPLPIKRILALWGPLLWRTNYTLAA